MNAFKRIIKFYFVALMLVVPCTHAIETDAEASHEFPTLYWDWDDVKATLRINALDAWRDKGVYSRQKKALEGAIIDNPSDSIVYSGRRVEQIINVVVRDEFDLEAVRGLFNSSCHKDIVGNHHAFIKECDVHWCPLSRAKNGLRTKFENDFVQRIKVTYPNTDDLLTYVGFGSSTSLMGDLRILMQLKMAGYKFEKIQFIDPSMRDVMRFIKGIVNAQKANPVELPQDAQKLNEIWSKNKGLYYSMMNIQVLAQFLAILSNYPGDDVIEYYLDVDSFFADQENDHDRPRIIASFDLLEPVDEESSDEDQEEETLSEEAQEDLVDLLEPVEEESSDEDQEKEAISEEAQEDLVDLLEPVDEESSDEDQEEETLPEVLKDFNYLCESYPEAVVGALFARYGKTGESFVECEEQKFHYSLQTITR